MGFSSHDLVVRHRRWLFAIQLEILRHEVLMLRASSFAARMKTTTIPVNCSHQTKAAAKGRARVWALCSEGGERNINYENGKYIKWSEWWERRQRSFVVEGFKWKFHFMFQTLLRNALYRCMRSRIEDKLRDESNEGKFCWQAMAKVVERWQQLNRNGLMLKGRLEHGHRNLFSTPS